MIYTGLKNFVVWFCLFFQKLHARQVVEGIRLKWFGKKCMNHICKYKHEGEKVRILVCECLCNASSSLSQYQLLPEVLKFQSKCRKKVCWVTNRNFFMNDPLPINVSFKPSIFKFKCKLKFI